ncbi:MAG TPA: PAS domain S-box protein, partial [Anaerolineae bacterium]|nr:PAS domain S-box protein [Anaerolineae bacterium]
ALAIIRDVTERKGAEEALRRSEDKFAKAFRTSPDAINITRMRDGQYLEINDGFTAMTGYMPAEVIGKTSLEINLWADPQTGTGLRQALKEHGEVIGLEAEFRTKDGSIRTGLMSARLIDVSGEPCVLSITRDITARERTEERIEQVNHLQGNLLAPLSLIEKLKLITDGVISIFGADFARIWITQPGDLCDANCVHAKVIEGPHVCRYRDRCLHLMSSSGRYTHINGKMHQRVPFNCYKIGRIAAGADSRFITNDVVHDARVHDRAWASELGLVSFAGYQLLSAAGQSMGVLALFSKHAISIDEDALLESIANTTAQVLQTARVEQALAQERNLLRTLIDNLPDAIYVKDTDCRKTLANHADVRNMRLESEAEALGKSDFEAYSQELAAKLYADDQMILKTGQPVLDREEIIDEVGGRQRWLLTSKLPLWDNAGQIVGIVGIGHDITERKRAEAEREKLIADLETKNAELERFTYTVSHDLKAPLITIRGFLGLLEKDTQTGNAEQMLADKQRIVEATDKMQRLLNELLELSRIGRLMNPPEAVEFATIVEGACKLVQGRLEVRGVEVTAAKDLPTVYGDRARLVEVVQNLVDNAAKFMGDQAEPRITIGQQGTDRDGRPIFFVRDNGQGIESQYHERIFGLFEKLDPYSEGTGIGLALVKRIVEVHGGRIWLESAGTNQGTTFFFALPCPPDDELRLER